MTTEHNQGDQEVSQSEPLLVLTPSELDEVRELLEADRRQRWLWRVIRVWSTWFMALLGGAAVVAEFGKRILESIGAARP